MLKEVSEKDQKNYKAKQGSAEAEINSNTVKKQTNKQTRICSRRNLL